MSRLKLRMLDNDEILPMMLRPLYDSETRLPMTRLLDEMLLMMKLELERTQVTWTVTLGTLGMQWTQLRH